MLSLPRILAPAVVAAAVVTGVAAYLLLPAADKPGAVESCAFASDLRKAEFPEGAIDILCSTTTELVSSENGQYEFVQHVPALALERRIVIAIHPDVPLDLSGDGSVDPRTGNGVFPLHHSIVGFSGGYDRYQSFFLPYDGTDPAILEQLGLRRAGARVTSGTHPIVLRSMQSSVLGAVLASVTTTTDTSGLGKTDPSLGASGGNDLGTTAPRLEDPQLEAYRREFVKDPARNELRTALTPEEQAKIRALRDTPEGKALTAREEAFSRELESKRASWELGRYGETDAQAVRRVQAERARQSSERAVGRIGSALAGLQAIGEWMQQGLDYFENDAALKAAEDCLNNPTNPVAKSAQAQDPENYNRARDQIHEARSDNNWDTGVRALNTANGAASSAIPGAAGMAMGIASGGNNANLRQLQQQRTQAAVGGVTPCNNSSTGGPSGGNTGSVSASPTGQPTAQPTTANGGSPTAAVTPVRTPGPSVIISPTVAATPNARNSLRVRVEQIHKFDGLDHTVTFSAVADLTNLRAVKDAAGRTVLQVPDVKFTGEGTGYYDEHGTATSQGGGCSVSLTGFVRMEVTVQVDIKEVDAFIGGSAARSETGDTHDCPHNVGDRSEASVSCVFEDVNFRPPAGRFYHAVAGDQNSDSNGVYQEQCILDFAPLFWNDGSPVTGPR